MSPIDRRALAGVLTLALAVGCWFAAREATSAHAAGSTRCVHLVRALPRTVVARPRIIRVQPVPPITRPRIIRVRPGHLIARPGRRIARPTIITVHPKALTHRLSTVPVRPVRVCGGHHR